MKYLSETKDKMSGKTLNKNVFNPSFLLRAIDPQQIFSKYIAGAYSNSTLESIHPKTRVNVVRTFGSATSTSEKESEKKKDEKKKEKKERKIEEEKKERKIEEPFTGYASAFIDSGAQHQELEEKRKKYATQSILNDETYLQKNGPENYITVVSSNHAVFEFFLKNQSLPKCGKCMWDQHDFDHEIVGIPIKYEHIDDGVVDKHIFHIDGQFCSYACAYAYLIQNNSMFSNNRPSRYNNSEELLHYAWRLVSKKDTQEHYIIPANSFLLIKPYGPLTIEEFRKNNEIYEPSPTIIFAPVKETFYKKMKPT